MRYHIVTFGCQMNEHDSNLLSGLMYANGHTEVKTIEEADILIVNTCCVRESAEHKIRSYLGSMKQYSQKNPGFMIAVFGCMVQQPGKAKALAKIGDYIGVLAGTTALGNLPAYIEQYLQTGKRIVDISEENKDADPTYIDNNCIKYNSSYKAEVSIIYGCNNFCSYCIVPYVRGRERSRKQETILGEINNLAKQGYKEVLLLGQNVNSFGKDLQDGTSFASLLKEVCKIDGIERIRYMSSHPRDITDELLEVIAANDKICKHYHLPLQSGNDRLLKLMNRGYSCEDYYRIIEKVRAAVPDAVITTDLIVGFPGETEDDFNQTLQFVKKCRFDAAYTFLYSQRSGTAAANLPDQIALSVKKERLKKLMDMQNNISLEINTQQIGKIVTILCEGVSHTDKNMQFGRTQGNKIVVFAPEFDQSGMPIDSTGQFKNVKITKANTWNFYGEIV